MSYSWLLCKLSMCNLPGSDKTSSIGLLFTLSYLSSNWSCSPDLETSLPLTKLNMIENALDDGNRTPMWGVANVTKYCQKWVLLQGIHCASKSLTAGSIVLKNPFCPKCPMAYRTINPPNEYPIILIFLTCFPFLPSRTTVDSIYGYSLFC